jgi:hypothetical protein
MRYEFGNREGGLNGDYWRLSSAPVYEFGGAVFPQRKGLAAPGPNKLLKPNPTELGALMLAKRCTNAPPGKFAEGEHQKEAQ